MKIMYIQVEEAVYATARSAQFTYLGIGDELAIKSRSQIVVSKSQCKNIGMLGNPEDWSCWMKTNGLSASGRQISHC